MSSVLAAALSGLVSGSATSLFVTWLHRRVLCGPRGSRWCRRCWARAVIRMDGWDTCVYCGDSAWARSEDDWSHRIHRGTTDKGSTRAPETYKPGHSAKITLLKSRRVDPTL